MKTLFRKMTLAMMAVFTIAMTSCEDERIARTLEGTWSGEMYAVAWYNGRAYDATYSQITFVRDPYKYSEGTGYWVDYYADSYWGGYNYIASRISWRVDFGDIYINLNDTGERVTIYNYSLNDDYFSGYLNIDGVKREFRLKHVSSPNYNWDWGYHYYRTPANSKHPDMKSIKIDEAPKRMFRIDENRIGESVNNAAERKDIVEMK